MGNRDDAIVPLRLRAVRAGMQTIAGAIAVIALFVLLPRHGTRPALAFDVLLALGALITVFTTAFLTHELNKQIAERDDAREEHERRAALLVTVTSSARRMSKLDSDHVWSVVVDSVVALGLEFAVIGVFDDVQQEFRVRHARGVPDDYAHTVHDASVGVVGLVRLRAETVVVADYARHPQALPMLVAAGIRSAIGTPLWSQGRMVGVLMGGRKSAVVLSPLEAESFELLGAQTSRALENVALAEELRSNEARFRALVQGASDLITVVDADTTIRYHSPPQRQLGYEADELIGVQLAHLVHPDDAPRLRAMCADIAAYPGAMLSAEFRAGRRDGSWVHLEASEIGRASCRERV